MKNILKITATALLLGAISCGCSEKNLSSQETSSASLASLQGNLPKENAPLSSENFFSNRDFSTEIDAETPITIEFQGDSIKTEGEGVSIVGSIATITEEGSYILTGTLNDGQVIVDTKVETDKVQLILDNVTMNCADSAPIQVVMADKVFITMAESSENHISATIPEGSTVDAGIFSKKDLTLNGNGTMNISVTGGGGIVGKDELTITSGTYNVISDGHGLDANDSIAIAEGDFHIISGKDGFHAEHKTNPEKGFIFILSGDFHLDVQQDGLDASGFLEIQGGDFFIETCGGWDAAPVKVAVSNNKGNRNGQSQVTQEVEDTPSRKGLKSAQELRLFQGDFQLSCYDDAIHSDTLVEIQGGNYEISTADDAIHSNWNTVISGGNIEILTSFEGIEGQRIYISGGFIDMYCGDDGINASSSNPDPEDSSISLVITGGTIILDSNSEGDGVDSNGNILITGGDILISSTTDQRDTALDSDKDSFITGGRFIGTGSASNTMQNFTTGSTQGSIVVSLPQVEQGDVTLTDSKGTVLVDFLPVKQYQAVIISLEELTQGETYYLTAGNYEETIKMTALQYGTMENSRSKNR